MLTEWLIIVRSTLMLQSAVSVLNFVRFTRRRSFPLGFLCRKLGFVTLERVVLCWTDICGSIQHLGLRSGGSAVVGSGSKQLCYLLVWVSVQTPCSFQFLFCVWQICHDFGPRYHPLLVFQPSWAMCLSNRIVWEVSFGVLCHLLG